MQLGTRWSVGAPIPRAVPELLHATIATVEADQGPETRATWTLTFLEGRAIAELDAGVEVRENADGTVSVEAF